MREIKAPVYQTFEVFEWGDKVKLIDSIYEGDLGSVGTIFEVGDGFIDDGEPWIILQGNPYWYRQGCFELVEEHDD